jgi:hypothetical protein
MLSIQAMLILALGKLNRFRTATWKKTRAFGEALD